MTRTEKQLVIGGIAVVGTGLLTWLLWPKSKSSALPATKPANPVGIPIVWSQGGALPPPPIDLPQSAWTMHDVSLFQTPAGKAQLATGLPPGTEVRLVLSNSAFGVPPSIYRAKALMERGSGSGIYVLQWVDTPQVERNGIVVSSAEYYEFGNKNVLI